MTIIKSINFGYEPERRVNAPSEGKLILSDTVTYLAGPNGSGKSRLLKWIANHMGHLNNLPQGSEVQFESEDVADHVRELFQLKAGGDGLFNGVIEEGEVLEVIDHDGNNFRLPYWKNPEADENAGIPGNLIEEVQEMVNGRNTRVHNRSVINFGGEIVVPAEFISVPSLKVLDARRMSTLREAFRRNNDPLRQIRSGNRSETSPNEVFALLESDTSLEVELLSRIEALTGVRIVIDKTGNQYEIKCSRPGIDGEWNYQEEADGIISLLILLPYIYSSEYDLLFIDEPEAHLYPGLQQILRSLIYEGAETTGKQIIVATHSERIVAPPLTDFRESIHIAVPNPRIPEIIQLHQSINRLGDFSHEVHDWLTEQAYGEIQSSIFSALFASEVIIVEGLFDMIFLDRIARYIGPEYRAGSVALIQANGKGGIANLVKFINSIGRQIKVITDSDIIDQPGVLRSISEAMGADENIVRDLLTSIDNEDFNELQGIARKLDIHVLSEPGIEGYYTTLDGEIPRRSNDKRLALRRELMSLEDLTQRQVRERYARLIEILESMVYRMPEEWLNAHALELNQTLANLLLKWDELHELDDVNELRRKLKPYLDKFKEVRFLEDGTLELRHRFLHDVPIVVESDSNPIAVTQNWKENFRIT